MPPTTLHVDESRQKLTSAAIVAGIILAGGLYFAPNRAWGNLLVGVFYLLSIALGGTVYLALTYLSGAGWHVAFRRVPAAMAMMVPLAGVAMLIVLALRVEQYGWHDHAAGATTTFWFKAYWLTPWFWYLRAIAYVVCWSVLSYLIAQGSRTQQIASPHAAFRRSQNRLSAIFLVVYAITFSLASVDWIMALEPMWFSTIWGVYNFAGMVMGSLAAMTILCVWLSRPGQPLESAFRTEHLHDLGKLLLGFSCFWMYIWFSQYMLIWYANIPEETSYFIARTHGSWGPVVLALIALNWLVPFFVLLPRATKRSPSAMLKIAGVILVGRWLDLCLMVFPPVAGEPRIGAWEVAAICCANAIGLVLFDRYFRRADPIPQYDAFLPESLHYHA